MKYGEKIGFTTKNMQFFMLKDFKSMMKTVADHTHNQNMVKTTNIWFAGYFSDVEISPNIYEVH
jgi:hypothetical protein